jgi:hypothetical protein
MNVDPFAGDLATLGLDLIVAEATPIAEHILSKTKELAVDLHLNESQLILELTHRNSLTFAKTILSYFRRLERYFMFFAEGRVKEPELIQEPLTPFLNFTPG